MNEEKKWRFCVVGNIVKTHLDEQGIVRYGTKAFSGGTKVYIPWKYWDGIDTIENLQVIGLNRFHRYAIEHVPFELLENIRFQILFKPAVLKIISYEDTMEGFQSWGRTADDKRGAKAFAERLSKRIDDMKKEREYMDLTLTEARERVQQDESEENINAFFMTLKSYIENDKWLPIIFKEGSNELETFNVNGKWYFGIYSGEMDLERKEFPTIVTGIKKLIDIINSNDDVAGLLIDPIDGNCFFVDKELIKECMNQR